MIVTNIDEKINAISQDEKVGVKLAFLTGDETMSIFAIELHQGQIIPAHYHLHGIETYYILSGEGKVFIGKTEEDSFVWESETTVKSGDCFTIYPNQVHKFQNTSNQILRIIASTPLSHSNNSDRFFVEEK